VCHEKLVVLDSSDCAS